MHPTRQTSSSSRDCIDALLRPSALLQQSRGGRALGKSRESRQASPALTSGWPALLV